MSQSNNYESGRSEMLPPLPLRLIRKIVLGGNHTIGQHVLIAGAHCTEIAEWMDELGFDVDVLDDEPNRVTAKLKQNSRFEIHLTSLDSHGIDWNDSFDLIIADELQLYRENLLASKARTATAELLSVLRPGGELVVVREPSDQSQHDAACWTRHLACFPGRLETIEYSAPLFSRETIQWILRGIRPEAFLTVSLRTPVEKISRVEWVQHAHRGVLTDSDPCCKAKSPFQQHRQHQQHQEHVA